jgi:hypothetical protein
MLGQWRTRTFAAARVSAVSARPSHAHASAVHAICGSLALVLSGCGTQHAGAGNGSHADAGRARDSDAGSADSDASAETTKPDAAGMVATLDAGTAQRDAGPRMDAATPACSDAAAWVFTWRKLEPSRRPPARYWHTLAFDDVRGSIVLFGGTTEELLADTWEWDGSSWSERKADPAPTARYLAAMVHDHARQKVLLFGGGQDPPIAFDDTWRWDGTRWERVATERQPSARLGAMVSYDVDRAVTVLFGGTRDDDPPSQPALAFEETWEWDGSRWSERSLARQPPGRAAGVMAYDVRRKVSILITGARDSADMLEDMWQWDGMNWSELTPGLLPPPRRDAQMVFDTELGLLILFGGYDNNQDFNDTWIWDGRCWLQLSIDSPPARLGVRLAYDAVRHETVLFGGVRGPAHETSDETWVLRGMHR